MYNVTTTIKNGGIETFYWEISKVLQQKGFDVEIISGKGDFIKYKDIKLKTFKFTSRDKILDLGNRFKKFGERVSFFKNSYKYLVSRQYDIFLIHKPLDFFTAFFMKRKNPKLRTIFVSGGEDFYGFDKYFSKYIDFMFAVSQDNIKKIENRYNREVHLIPNGVNTEKFNFNKISREDFRNKYNIKDKTVLISVGRIVGLKGYQLIIESLPNLENCHYICIGNGEYLTNLRNLAKELKVENRVSFLGDINNNDLPDYLSMADIFVQPSIGNEAFGITLLEAMSCNLPIIASYNGGMKEVIEDGAQGYFFEIGNTKELEEKIQLLIQNLDKFKFSREYVIKNFTWESSVNKLLKVIS
jgi:glycosyltransferase involved in cell wall biosynthesis